MEHWRLIALDLDGTVLSEEGTISNENKEWLNRAKQAGIEITIATGRPVQHFRKFLTELNIQVPYVAANGSEVWTTDGDILERHTLNTEDVEFMHQLAVRYETRFWSSVVDHLFRPGTFPDNAQDYQWLKFGFQSMDMKILEIIRSQLTEYGLEVTSSDPSNLEVNPLGVSKASGLQAVCKHLQIRPSEVVGIGDGLNDVSMIRWAGLGIAMGNACLELKQIANWVTADFRRHGVAKAVEFLLNNKNDAPHKDNTIFE
ncbi:Cof-type HAD-IIB family hydrolase [Ammoniphilus resinae]|uniref:HAD superfamily hydrolase (TIGR01484 family) n=1 Tax=Ammoniphilus resinae TaxID=861532 RepID=A0ABS4GP42_9BACL|nr:Cof-type HAD-IIB family hydrolase [Ammoniphilus resinae]MBP1931630.1 HAD superfamily hydrolase (TIGR01484 family) [Ammoniphilus resinae]